MQDPAVTHFSLVDFTAGEADNTSTSGSHLLSRPALVKHALEMVSYRHLLTSSGFGWGRVVWEGVQSPISEKNPRGALKVGVSVLQGRQSVLNHTGWGPAHLLDTAIQSSESQQESFDIAFLEVRHVVGQHQVLGI